MKFVRKSSGSRNRRAPNLRRRRHQHHSGENNQTLADAMLRRSAGADLYVEQMLLAPAAYVGRAAIAQAGALSDEFHQLAPSILARESAITRRHRST